MLYSVKKPIEMRIASSFVVTRMVSPSHESARSKQSVPTGRPFFRCENTFAPTRSHVRHLR